MGVHIRTHWYDFITICIIASINQFAGSFLSIPMTSYEAQMDRMMLLRWLVENTWTFLTTEQRPSKKQTFANTIENRRQFGLYPEIQILLTEARSHMRYSFVDLTKDEDFDQKEKLKDIEKMMEDLELQKKVKKEKNDE